MAPASTSSPRRSGLAINLELPLVIVDVQRGGPSTGLPTKTEQADLLHAMYGRHGEAPLPILAPQNPSDCFAIAIEATRLAVKYRTPVIVLSDGYLANGAEPWKLPDLDALRAHRAQLRHASPTTSTRTARPASGPTSATPRPWPARGPRPGCPGLEHRIGGLEKADGSGNVSYDGVNHERMVHLRRDKIAGIADDIPLLEVNDETGDAQLLLVSWGSTYAAVAAGVKRVRARGMKAAHAHLRYLNPLPANLGEVLRPLHPGAGARDQPGPAQPDPAGRVPGRRPVTQQDAGRAVPCRRDRGSHHRAARRKVMTIHRQSRDHPQGLEQRPGGALVPRLRRLLHPGRRADADARPRRAP